jgi:hypothetical protein
MLPSDGRSDRGVRKMAIVMVSVALIFAAVSLLVLWLTIVGR